MNKEYYWKASISFDKGVSCFDFVYLYFISIFISHI